MKKRVILLAATLLLVGGVAVGFWLWPREAAQPTVGVLQDIQPPICTQNVGEQECGAGVLQVRTEAGRQQTYRFGPETRLVASDVRDISFLALGSRLALTLSGDGETVAEVRVLR